MSEQVDEVEIKDDAIRLVQLLKLADLVEAGGDARYVLSTGEVSVNGEVETRRGRQLRDGDVVTLGGRSVRVRAR